MIMLNSLDPATIHRDTPIPYHYQLSELLRQEIETGRWKVGEQIPAEEELCAHFSLSRTTVRKSLDALVNRGLVHRAQGRGTFVAEPKLIEGLVNRPIGFLDDMTERGIKVVTQVLELRRIVPSDVVAHELELPPGATVVETRRLRSIFDQPVVVVNSYVPYDMCPSLLEADLTKIGLYQFLRENGGYHTYRAKSFVEAVGADELESQLLGVKVGGPLLMIESTVYLADGRPIDYNKSRHRGDRLRLIMERERLGLSHLESKVIVDFPGRHDQGSKLMGIAHRRRIVRIWIKWLSCSRFQWRTGGSSFASLLRQDGDEIRRDVFNLVLPEETDGKVLHAGFTIVYPGCKTKGHTHPDREEVYYFVRGKGIMGVEDKEYEVVSGRRVLCAFWPIPHHP